MAHIHPIDAETLPTSDSKVKLEFGRQRDVVNQDGEFVHASCIVFITKAAAFPATTSPPNLVRSGKTVLVAWKG